MFLSFCYCCRAHRCQQVSTSRCRCGDLLSSVPQRLRQKVGRVATWSRSSLLCTGCKLVFASRSLTLMGVSMASAATTGCVAAYSASAPTVVPSEVRSDQRRYLIFLIFFLFSRKLW